MRNVNGDYNNLIDQRKFQIEEWFKFKIQYRDLTRNILKPEERLLITENWPDADIESPEFKDIKLVTTFNEMRIGLQSKSELNGILTDVIMTRQITVDMMALETDILKNILDIIAFEKKID